MLPASRVFIRIISTRVPFPRQEHREHRPLFSDCFRPLSVKEEDRSRASLRLVNGIIRVIDEILPRRAVDGTKPTIGALRQRDPQLFRVRGALLG